MRLAATLAADWSIINLPDSSSWVLVFYATLAEWDHNESSKESRKEPIWSHPSLLLSFYTLFVLMHAGKKESDEWKLNGSVYISRGIFFRKIMKNSVKIGNDIFDYFLKRRKYILSHNFGFRLVNKLNHGNSLRKLVKIQNLGKN